MRSDTVLLTAHHPIGPKQPTQDAATRDLLVDGSLIMTGKTEPDARRRAESAETWRRQEAERARRESERIRRARAKTRTNELREELASLELKGEMIALQFEKGGSLDRADKRTLGWWTLGWVPATAAWFVSMFLLDVNGVVDLNANATMSVAVAGLLPLLFWVVPIVRMQRRRSTAMRQRWEVRSRIAEIHEELGKLAPRRKGSDSSPSLRQANHAWYGDHSELNWRHREQGQALGFDNAHDYVNNFLESE